MHGCGGFRSRCKNMQSLRDHLRDRHESFMCEICVENKKVFLGEQTLYTKGKLQRHIEKGEPEIGFFGHPMCKFCQKRFYDTMHLYDHLTKNHMQCDLCEKAGVRHKYYRDYRDLEKHFKAAHFLCDDPHCLEQRFVVFYTDIEYQAHLVSTHPELAVSRKVPVQFKVRGSRQEVRQGVDLGMCGRDVYVGTLRRCYTPILHRKLGIRGGSVATWT